MANDKRQNNDLQNRPNLFHLDIKHFIKWSMLYYVTIIKHIDSNILFILDDDFNKKCNVCYYKCIFWHSFQQGKA
jgi:hypothetical protein